MNASIHNKVLQKIARLQAGELIFPADLKDAGSAGAVTTALNRLLQEKTIERIAQGIYMKPKNDPVLGNIPPSLDEIAIAIARRDKARLLPSGAYALHKLGISTQVPTKLVYLTDGAPRQIQIGNRTIKFKTAAAKKLSLKGEISMLVIQALSELGPNGVTPAIENKLKAALKNEKPNNIKHDAELAPVWIGEKLVSFASQI